MTNRELKWRHLKALHQIYESGFTKNKIQGHPYINYLIRNEVLKPKLGKPEVLEKGFNFDGHYEKHHLQNFQHYIKFLSENSVLANQSNYCEKDIQRLIFIKEQKEQILADTYTRHKFSKVFFKEEKTSKYLDNNRGLEKAVLSILGFDKFPGKDPIDQQYKFVINCPTPEIIVLCENIDFLLLPWIARENNIELWYAGGNNIAKLDHLPPIKFPIFYSCDWDYEGLRIYERIKKKIPQIKILFPSALNERITVYSPNHNSDWKYDKEFSGLQREIYSFAEVDLINQLISKKEWIEEEDNDLIEMTVKERGIY